MKIYIGKSDEAVDAVAEFIKQDPVGSMGYSYIGTVVEWFFLGILWNQVMSYYDYFPNDSRMIKRLVLVVFILSMFKATQAFTIIWDKNIVGFGDWRVAAAVPWNLITQAFSSCVVYTTAQSFFVWRCFTLTGRNWWLLGFLVSCMASTVAFSIAAGVRIAYDPYHIPSLIPLGVPMLMFSTTVDIVITVVVSWKLAKSRSGFNKDTDTVLKRLLAITLESAAPPTISQLLNVLFFVAWGQANSWHGMFVMITPSLYVFSLMHTLNSRVAIRMSSSFGTSDERSQQFEVTINGHKKYVGDVVPLGTLSKSHRRVTINRTEPISIEISKEVLVHTSTLDGTQRVHPVLEPGRLDIPVGQHDPDTKGAVNIAPSSEDGVSLASSKWGPSRLE